MQGFAEAYLKNAPGLPGSLHSLTGSAGRRNYASEPAHSGAPRGAFVLPLTTALCNSCERTSKWAVPAVKAVAALPAKVLWQSSMTAMSAPLDSQACSDTSEIDASLGNAILSDDVNNTIEAERGPSGGVSSTLQSSLQDATSELAKKWHQDGSLRLSSHQPLLDATERQNCPRCKRSRQYFCYDCLLVMAGPVPSLQLPVRIDILQHGEVNSLSSAVHAKLLAPSRVNLLRHKSGNSHHRRMMPRDLELPEYDPATTAVLFPSPGLSKPVEEMPPGSLQTILVVDSKWKKATTMLRDPRIRDLPRVHLTAPPPSSFWRRATPTTRGYTEDGVCSIEAIYCLCRELHLSKRPECGSNIPCQEQGPGACHCYDDLLYYFTFISGKISKDKEEKAKSRIGRVHHPRVHNAQEKGRGRIERNTRPQVHDSQTAVASDPS